VPNLITRTDPGDLFTLRNAGNLVPVYGDDGVGEAATIEYAVKALSVPDIVVCGHTCCGAMAAIVNPELCADFPTVASWVAKAQAVVERVRERYGSELNSEELLDAVIQENVLMQIDNLRTHPCVAQGLENGTLRLHGWVYSIGTGEMLAYDSGSGSFVACDKERSEALSA
jgi:carbonic anhydrase